MGIIYEVFGFLLRLCYQLCNNNFIVALVLFTVVAKIIMLPMGISQQKSSAKMAKMQPEMNKLKQKYASLTQRGTPEQQRRAQAKYNEEIQALYQKYDYKMTAGCLPLLIQFPIIIGLFGVIYYPMTYVLNIAPAGIIERAGQVLGSLSGEAYKLVESVTKVAASDYSASKTARGAEIIIAKAADLMDFDLFGIIDLSQTPSLDTFSWLWLIPLAAGASQILSGYIGTRLNGQELNSMSKGMIFGMPIMSVVIAFSLPATIGFYWTISSILQIGQSFLVKKLYSPEREEMRREKIRQKEREAKLDRLRRLHGDDEDVPAEPAKKVEGINRPVIKDDPESREFDGVPVKDEPEEKPQLSRKEQKELNRKKLNQSRND